MIQSSRVRLISSNPVYSWNNYGSLKDTLLKIKDEGRTDKINRFTKLLMEAHIHDSPRTYVYYGYGKGKTTAARPRFASMVMD